MATNGFKVFDEQKTNTLTDAEYAADTQRINGVETGVARSDLINKALRQSSTMAAALGKTLADKGYDASDGDYVALAAALQDALGGDEGVMVDDVTGKYYRLGMENGVLYITEA